MKIVFKKWEIKSCCCCCCCCNITVYDHYPGLCKIQKHAIDYCPLLDVIDLDERSIVTEIDFDH